MDDIFDKVDPSELNHSEEDRNYLEELVGEGRKFKSPEDLAKGKFYADQAIDVLKQRLQEAQNELQNRKSLEDFMTEMKTLKTPVEPEYRVSPDAPKPVEVDIESQFEQLFAKREAKQRMESNRDKVTRVLNDHFGDQAKVAINRKAQELGMSLQDLQDLAFRSPNALFNLLGVSEVPRDRAAPTVPVSTTAGPYGSQVNTGARGKKYYDNLKKTNPALYNHPDTLGQMMKDAAALGGMAQFNAN